MEHPFEKYYLDRPLRSLVDELSDRKLDVNRHREHVNKVVMSVVIQYLGQCLKVPSRDPREIGKKTRERKAAIKEKRIRENFGQKMVENALKGDEHSGRTHDDSPGLHCLMDTAASAALFKEVAFTDRFVAPGQFFGIDLGSGTGILTLATAIAGRRSGVQSYTVGLDRETDSVRQSTEILSRLLSQREFIIQAADIRMPGLLNAVFNGLPLSLWVSETISVLTPSMKIQNGDLTRTGAPDDLHSLMVQVINNVMDPYFEVLSSTMKDLPRFLGDVQQGVTAMFPNLVNEDYKPDEKRGGTLKLRTSSSPQTSLPLARVGREFAIFEQPVAESISDEKWFRFPSIEGCRADFL